MVRPVLHLLGQDSRALARKAGITLDDARRITGARASVAARRSAHARNVAPRGARPGRGARHAGRAAPCRDRRREGRASAATCSSSPDGARVEAVRIPLFDDAPHRLPLVAGRLRARLRVLRDRRARARPLAPPWEIVAQLLHVRADATRPVTGAVFMGQGEPFLNYDAVLEAAYALVRSRRRAASTRGASRSPPRAWSPMIRRYTAEGHKFRLCVSLNAAIPGSGARSCRRAGVPARRARRRRPGARGAARPRDARVRDDRGRERRARRTPPRSGRLLARHPGPPQPHRGERRDRPLPPAGEAEWNAFRDALARELPGQPIVRRYSGGQDEHAACGMLASPATLPAGTSSAASPATAACATRRSAPPRWPRRGW